VTEEVVDLGQDLVHKVQVVGVVVVVVVVGRRDHFADSVGIAGCISDLGPDLHMAVAVVVVVAVAVVVVNCIAGSLLPPRVVPIAAGAWMEAFRARRSRANRVASLDFRTDQSPGLERMHPLLEPAIIAVSNQSPTVARGIDLLSLSLAQGPIVVVCAVLFSYLGYWNIT